MRLFARNILLTAMLTTFLTASSPVQADPILGDSQDAGQPAVQGEHQAESGWGVYGKSDRGTGVVGTSNTWMGVYGGSKDFIGVYGEGGTGVAGKSVNWYGVQGDSTNYVGVAGLSDTGVGIAGF